MGIVNGNGITLLSVQALGSAAYTVAPAILTNIVIILSKLIMN